MALTPKQAAFVREYLADLNATQAAVRAGYSERTAKQQGQRLLTKADVAAAIAAAQAERSARTQVTTDAVVAELAKVAFSDMRSFVEWGPAGVALKDSKALSAGAAACVAEVSQTTSESGGSLKFKLHGKVQALELLGRHLGMFKDRLDVNHQGGVCVVNGIDLAAVLGQRPGAVSRADHDRLARG